MKIIVLIKIKLNRCHLIGTKKPSLHLSDTFIFNFLIISFIFIENKCHSDEIWDLKRVEKKVWQKAGSRSIASNSMRFTIYTTETDAEWASFFSVDYPNHTLAGGVSVNSLCQQGINRQADIKKRTVRASTGNSRWTKHRCFWKKNIVVNEDICIRMRFSEFAKNHRRGRFGRD